MKPQQWTTDTNAAPVGAQPGRHFGTRSYTKPMVGLATLVFLVAVVTLAWATFNGSFVRTVPVTVLTDRAGLLMDPGGKVKLNGGQIGTVSAVTRTSDGRAELSLAIDPDRLRAVPENARVEISANTVFGAKSVDFLSPADPSATPMRPGQVLDSEHVTVETNTIFDDLNSVLAHIDPAKLNQTLGAMSTAFSGRGEAFGRSLTDLNDLLGTIQPALPVLSHELQTFPEVASAYADAAPDIMAILRNTSRISRTLVGEQDGLDRLLVSTIGLSDIATEVIDANTDPLANLMHLLVPTTDLTNEYHEALTCSLTGIIDFVRKPPAPVPGVNDLGALTPGLERYRYPQDLPKVAAAGGPQCRGQLPLQFNIFPPRVIADVGTDPTRYGNQNILLNSDGLKQLLFGPIDAPPRNSAQWGQPG